jgi:sugar/nucleoside kinase (ribokinase family)
MTSSFDVVAVGNAIVDILFRAPESFLIEHGITRGAMTLIDADRALELTDLFQGATIQAGGSAANSMNGIASLGGRAAYIGKVANDAMGSQFTAAFRHDGVHFTTPPRDAPPATARCLIAVTPDGQRSMNTYLGASTLLDSADIDQALIESGAVLFLEGYLFDRDEAKAAFVKAAEIARAAGRKVAITLSDTFCVERHRASFRQLVAHHVDIVFANEHEITALYETDSLQAAITHVRADGPIAAITRSALGSIIVSGADEWIVTAAPVAHVIDTTGAGDLYAAGFLFGYAHGRPLGDCGRLGAIAAGEVISHMGPRPEQSLKNLAAAAGL